MIVFDLRCENGHRFEGWFADGVAFATQNRDGLLLCPFCGETRVERQISPLRIGGGEKGPAPPVEASSTRLDDERADGLRKLVELQARMLEKSTWVGDRFAQRARAMAEGEEPSASIHVQATVAEAKALHDEGVAVMPLPFRVVPPEQQN